jgi:hypothetical protein
MPPAKTPPDQPQDEYLKTLVALQETVKESQTQVRESSEALIEAHLASLEQLAERLIEGMRGAAAERPIEVIVQPPPPAVDDQITREQRLRQRQLVLSYDAFRTMLGRAPTSGSPGAAVVFMAMRVNDKGQRDACGDSIVIPRPAPFASVEDGWTLVAITTANQTLRAPLHRHDLPTTVQVKHLRADVDIGRLEIRDASDDPLYLGVGPATQTHNVERHRRMHQGGEAAAPVERGDDAPHPHEDLTTSTPELDREIR